MKGLLAMAAGVVISTSLVAAAQTAPAQGQTPEPAKHKQGIQNVRKAQQSKNERDKTMRAVKKRAQAAKKQYRVPKTPAPDAAKIK